MPDREIRILTVAMQETVRMPDREIRILTAAVQVTALMPDRKIRILTAAMQEILQMLSVERMQHRVRRIPETPVYWVYPDRERL